MDRPIHVVILGGGTGTTNVARGLLPLAKPPYSVQQTFGVTVTDNGGSTQDFIELGSSGCLGDFMRVALALSPCQEAVARLDYRISRDAKIAPTNVPAKLAGMSYKNLHFFSYIQRFGFREAVRKICEELHVEPHCVFPVSLENTTLMMEVTNHETNIVDTIKGETSIAKFLNSEKFEPRFQTVRLFIDPSISAWPELVQAINVADYILLGPGSIRTSTLAALKPTGICGAIKESRGQLVFIPNLMELEWQRHESCVEEYVDMVESEVGRPCDVILYGYSESSRLNIPGKIWEHYRWNHKHKVKTRTIELKEDPRLVCATLLGLSPEKDIIHDPALLCEAFKTIFKKFPTNQPL